MIKQLATKVVYQNPWMTVNEDQVEFANGHQGIFGVVHKDDFALIVPFDGEKLYLVTQYRYPTQRDSIEFPQGKHEDGPEVNPEALARAELQEETGFVAGSMTEIGFFHEAPGYCDQGFHLYFATDLQQQATKLDVTEVGLEKLAMTPAEFEAAVIAGQITDAPTISAYGLAKMRGLV